MTGRKVLLRDWEEKDLDSYGHWLQPGHAWHQFDAPYYKADTPEEINARLAKLKDQVLTRNFPEPRGTLVVADKTTSALIGRVNSYWESKETNWLSIGIDLYDAALWGRGLGYEALGIWTDYVFSARPELARLGLATWSGNRGMMRLAEKLGFKEEARFRKARIINGEFFDSMGYGVLREEWTARFPDSFAAQL